MRYDACWADGSRVRTVLGLAAACACYAAAAPAAAQVTQTWIERDFIPGQVANDKAKDIVHWEDPATGDKFVYVTGATRTTSGVTVVATTKYKAPFDPAGQEVRTVYYPSDPFIATGTHLGVAIDVDPVSGDIYVAAETFDENSVNGFDYAVLKYDKDLDPDPLWLAQGGDPVGFRRYNGPANGHDRPVDIVFVHDKNIPSHLEHHAVAVTGTSYGGVLNGQDVMTLLYRADDGTLDTTYWSATTIPVNAAGERRYHYSGNDRVVGVDFGFSPTAQEFPAAPLVYIAGTQLVTGSQGDNIFAIEYWAGAVIVPMLGPHGWDGPEHGNDVATGIDANAINPEFERPTNWVAVSGYSLHADTTTSARSGRSSLTIADTDYIILNLSDNRWLRGIPGFWDMRIWSGPGPSSDKSDDFSTDIDIAVIEDLTGQGNHEAYAWITGRVRDSAGVTMDVGTIMYELHKPMHLDPPVRAWTYTLVSWAQEGGIAIDAVETPTGASTAFVSAWAAIFSYDYLVLKYNRNTGSQTFWAWYNANGGIDLSTSLAAPDPTTVFVTGESHNPITLRDFLTIRYDGP